VLERSRTVILNPITKESIYLLSALVKAIPNFVTIKDRINRLNLGKYEEDKIDWEPDHWHTQKQEQGKKVADLCREHGISQPTFYQWKSKYSGLDVNQLKRIKDLESELAQYKKIVAEQTLDIRILKDLNSKKF
jgi:putative transposase